jgi:hypothetical protein
MPLTDIVFGQDNTNATQRGNTGVVSDSVSAESMTTLIRSGVVQRWNATLSRWEVIPLRYRSDDGWV